VKCWAIWISMGKLELTGSWDAKGNVSVLQALVRAFFKKKKMTVIGQQAGEIHVKQGSPLLTRLLGSWLSPKSWLPKRAVVRLSEKDAGVAVRARIEEASTLQTIEPRLEAKYNMYFACWMRELKSRIR